MRILRAAHLGMCFGVRDAIALALERADAGPLTILGDLVHNPTVLSALEAKGIAIAQDPGRTVARSIVDDDQLDPQRHGEHPRDDLADRLAFVEHGHHHAEQRMGELATFLRHDGRGRGQLREYYTPWFA